MKSVADHNILLELTNLSLLVSETEAHSEVLFSALQLTLSRGDAIGLFGPNGCGKSTLLRSIVGLRHAFEGSINLQEGARVGYSPQNYRSTLIPWISVKQHIKYAVGNDIDRVDFFLDKLEFKPTAKSKLAFLSGGELQLLLLSTVLARDFDLLLLDEPLSAVDTHRRRIALKLIESELELRKRGLLMVTHLSSDIEQICSKIYIFSGARGDIVKKKIFEAP
jgi:ABC-type multidrug transport system ATPase subunit